MARALLDCISGNCSCTEHWGPGAASTPTTEAAQLQPGLSWAPAHTGGRQHRFLGSGQAAGPTTGTGLGGSSAAAPGNDPWYVSVIRKDKLNKTGGSEEWESHKLLLHSPQAPFSHSPGESREDKVPGVRARVQETLNSQVNQQEKESKKPRETLVIFPLLSHTS